MRVEEERLLRVSKRLHEVDRQSSSLTVNHTHTHTHKPTRAKTHIRTRRFAHVRGRPYEGEGREATFCFQIVPVAACHCNASAFQRMPLDCIVAAVVRKAHVASATIWRACHKSGWIVV